MGFLFVPLRLYRVREGDKQKAHPEIRSIFGPKAALLLTEPFSGQNGRSTCLAIFGRFGVQKSKVPEYLEMGGESKETSGNLI